MFCNLPTPSPSPDESYATDAEMRISGAGKKRKRRRKQVKGCRAEFDYAGWSRNNIWRRETAVVKAGRRGEEVVTKVGSKDCWNECDFPSECHNHRSSLSVETGRSLRQRILIEVEVEGPDQVGDVGWETHVGAHLGQEPSLADLWKELDTERRGQEDEAKLMNVDLELQIGGLPVDYDLPHEEGCQLEYRKPKRKNSIQMIQQLTGLMLGSTDVDMGGESPPSSPLKTAFSVEDEDELIESGRELELDDDGGDLGCCTDCEERIQVCHVEDREVVDVQMEELLQTRTMFLSQFDGDQWDRLI